jgi:hypothetical protein
MTSEKITVWCAVASFVLIGPCFFEDDEGIAVMVTLIALGLSLN